MSIAVVFPGQGAAVPGAGRAWVGHPSWSVVERAEAVLLTSLVVWHAVQAELPGLAPVAFAGHSLGQVTALVAAGGIDADDGWRLASARAELSQASADARPGRMAALVGADLAVAEAACAAADEAWVANDNAPGQVVIAGTAAGLDAAAEAARGLGVRRVLPLDVGHAFHTPLLADAARGLRPVLDACRFAAPLAPVVANTDARPHAGADGWPSRLERHLVEPVRWRESQLALTGELGAGHLLELGPGNVLAGLAKRTVPDVAVTSAATPDDVDALAASLRSLPDAVSTPPDADTRGAA